MTAKEVRDELRLLYNSHRVDFYGRSREALRMAVKWFEVLDKIGMDPEEFREKMKEKP